MSGDYRGSEEILAFLRRTAELTGGTYRVELLWVVADDEPLSRSTGRGASATAVARSTSSRPC